ncbi:MAG: hypothetical protein CVT80_05785 [Alphaproteobacteria bacterium HGW-Alphaproteobacteria-2]|nr:MAG: hypothetical protein CVT80_05785 [Alphaproteobacteria bacterium HGW-Alphaproteobacteria-2]
MRIGAIADDFTGASDLGNMLARGGMNARLCIGVPDGPSPEADAVVIALKTRSIPATDAVAQALAVLDWLRVQGCGQVYFKYCSTFDSTPDGNIGPVLDALAEALGAPRAVVVPAFPATGRRLMMGHLFVGDQLLNRSGMEHHPLNPMTEPDIRRWLALQTRFRVGHVDIATVHRGAGAIRDALDRLTVEGARHIVVDTIDDDDLRSIGAAVAGDVLVSGGSGLALGLTGSIAGPAGGANAEWGGNSGRAAALVGSCSAATRAQVARHARTEPVLHLDPLAVAGGSQTAEDAAGWVLSQGAGRVPLVASTMEPGALAAVQNRLGREASAVLLEIFFGDLARLAVAGGIGRLIVAGGETSGAVVSALGLRSLSIGPEIAPGVPALAPDGADFVCTLKSGNFGDEAFFVTAARVLAGGQT